MTTPFTAQEMNGHELLLAMAGRIPDKALAAARRVLASDSQEAAITLLAELLAQTPIPLTAAELAAIRELARNPHALPGTRPVTAAPPLPFVFGIYEESGAATRDELDEALAAAAEAHSGSLSGIWRSWRYLQLDSDEAGQAIVGDSLDDPFGPYRVYLIQVTDPARIQGVAADLLAAIGEPAEAGIEIIVLDREPPPYQRAALSQSLLLWATTTEPRFELARVFDFADPVTGPGFGADHRVIEDPAEIARLGEYLRGGYPTLTTATTMTDVIDPASGAAVPASFRTDGRWIWTDSVVYYLTRHGMAPDSGLTEHIEAQIARGVAVPDVDIETAIDAANFLLYPPGDAGQAAVWFPSGGYSGARR